VLATSVTPPPPRPSTPADMWSFGCLLTEALTGSKLFRQGDKLAAVLRPSQLLMMRLGAAEAACTEAGQEGYFSLIQEVISLCLEEDPAKRITAEAALRHPALHLPHLHPQHSDLLLLPSPVLRLAPVGEEGRSEEERGSEEEGRCEEEQGSEEEGRGEDDGRSEEELLASLRSSCSEYGAVTEVVVAEGGGAFVHFQEEAWLIF